MVERVGRRWRFGRARPTSRKHADQELAAAILEGGYKPPKGRKEVKTVARKRKHTKRVHVKAHTRKVRRRRRR